MEVPAPAELPAEDHDLQGSRECRPGLDRSEPRVFFRVGFEVQGGALGYTPLRTRPPGQEQQFLNSKGSSMAFKVFSRQADRYRESFGDRCLWSRRAAMRAFIRTSGLL